MSVFLLFLGIALGATFYHCGLWLRKRHPKATTERPQKDWEFYGHPKRPVPTLRERLPQPPSGHVWEIAVRYDKGGEAFLHLTLVNVAAVDAGIVATTSVSLVRRDYGAWAETYRELEYRSNHIKWFDEKLIGPLVDWANNQVNRIVNAGNTGDYTMYGGAS